MTRRRMFSTTVYLTQEQVDALHAASRRTGRSMAELIRNGVDTVLWGEGCSPAYARVPESQGGPLNEDEATGR